ncbi:MAG TPA: hypothetical protein VK988_03315 [Acidimicrobiales bacterium]|nr:hypothetical protein [Acidimicrobiales bacterium]
MRVEHVDPRDVDWEIDAPDYRVYFWKRHPLPSDVPEAFQGWQSDEYELTETDLHEVIDWVERRVDRDGTYVLYAVVNDHSRGRGLVRLAGVDPTRQR